MCQQFSPEGEHDYVTSHAGLLCMTLLHDYDHLPCALPGVGCLDSAGCWSHDDQAMMPSDSAPHPGPSTRLRRSVPLFLPPLTVGPRVANLV
jgi:hypothetical protein